MLQAITLAFKLVKDGKGKNLPPLHRLVLLYLANRYNPERKGCWPSFRLIASDCGVSVSTAKRAVFDLTSSGTIRATKRRHNLTGFESNLYTFPYMGWPESHPSFSAESLYVDDVDTPLCLEDTRALTDTRGVVSHRHQGGVPQTPGWCPTDTLNSNGNCNRNSNLVSAPPPGPIGKEFGLDSEPTTEHKTSAEQNGDLGAGDHVVTKKNRKSKNGTVNPLHAPVRGLIAEAYEFYVHQTVPWDGRTAKVLATILAKSPSWTKDEWEKCIANRFDSEGENLSEDPLYWLPKLAGFYVGPHDRFGKAKQPEE